MTAPGEPIEDPGNAIAWMRAAYALGYVAGNAHGPDDPGRVEELATARAEALYPRALVLPIYPPEIQRAAEAARAAVLDAYLAGRDRMIGAMSTATLNAYTTGYTKGAAGGDPDRFAEPSDSECDSGGGGVMSG